MSAPARPRVERVLVVDDDRDGAEMVAELLADLGYQARFALDGASALILAREFLPQLVLLDISLPDMSGVELARQLRLEPRLTAVSLVAVTGWSGPEKKREALEAGIDHFLVKPLTDEALEQVLAR